ncbi:tetratricopeptide repeat protein [Verticiella alkaliphila]|uniref:tetratricopeptide repeat protein n=1 Tax=Verticiella alkaliphila TaxID=2779529 RepID=UPI003FCC8F2B
MDRITPLETMLAAGKDNSLLRYGLGQAYLDDGQPTPAITHLRACVAHDATYSAAWKLLGKAYMAAGDTAAAADAWRHGIAAAQGRGDKQAEKEMTVFVRRAERSPGPHPD